MSKQRRQQALLELISEYEIDTQEELTRRLQALGFETTQATVSRDIRELKLEKVSYGSGKHRYAASLEPDTGTHASYQHVMASCILSIEAAQNIIVVKTVSGMAMAAAAALDEMQIPEIVGSIAGDNTLMCVARSADEGLVLMEKIRKMIV